MSAKKTKGVGTGGFDAATIDRYFAAGAKATFFGKSVLDMTRDQLVAALGCAGMELQSMRERHTRDLVTLRELSRPSLTIKPRKSLRERIVGGSIIT